MLRKMKNEPLGFSSAHLFGPSLLLTALALVPLIPFQTAQAEVPFTSGTIPLGNTLQFGSTSYTIYYSYPPVAQVGTNMTIVVTLRVGLLTGSVDYVANYRILADVFIGGQLVSEGSVKADTTAAYLYSGTSWGPNNVTLPLTEANTGLSKGNSANASLRLRLQDQVFAVIPIYGGTFTSEPAMEGSAGSVLIQDAVPTSTTSTSTGHTTNTNTTTILPYALLGAGLVLMVVAVVLPKGSRTPQGNKT
jgi:hypothetical protein